MTTQQAEKPYKIFIVDDDEFLLDMYTLKFKEAGCIVEGIMQSSEALAQLRKGVCPDALLLDVVMPGMDGIELLKTMRHENLCSEKTAVIILSNQGQDSDIELAREQGVDGYLVKASTVPSEVLVSVLDTIRAKQEEK